MPVINVLDSTMFHRQEGSGPPVVFLHGNPTSSYLWRNVLPGVGGHRLAPDLIGMGESGKPDIAYTFDDHVRFLDAWIDALDLDRIVLVGHDWGGALAFDWAARHPDRVRGVAVTEAIVKSMSWQEFPDAGRGLFEAIKTPGVGEAMILDDNMFIEQALPATVARGLSPVDLEMYRRPYPTPRSRRPLLEWPRAMPLGGHPPQVVARIDRFRRWLTVSSEVPKLLLTFEPGPGTMLGEELIAWCRSTMAALEVVHHDLVAGHHTPEDEPEAVAATLDGWLKRKGI